ncbi:MAG: hypothetical protein HW414_752, partial [Dehalococcoidia bacterium]|nr:hypothetical protein [Dehalococcoidia bacterium]
VNGTGFPSSTNVDILYDGDLIATSTTAISGVFSALFSVPESTAGYHAVAAKTSVSDISDAVRFEVKPSISGIALASGGVNTLVTITGKGFAAADNNIAVMLGTVKIGTAASNNKGTITGKQMEFAAFPGGTYEMKATDSAGNSATAREKFTVKANMTITPTDGDVGTQVTLGGTGFLADTSISLILDKTTLKPATPVRTASTGSFTGSFVIPKMSAGAHTITVTDGNNSYNATWTMENTPPPAPSPRAPVNKQAPAFAWGEVTDPSGVTYDFQVAREATFAFPILARENLTTTSYALSPVEALERGLYYWRARAVDGAGNTGAWSTPLAVRIGWPLPTWALGLLALLALAIIVLFVRIISRSIVARL